MAPCPESDFLEGVWIGVSPRPGEGPVRRAVGQWDGALRGTFRFRVSSDGETVGTCGEG